MANTSEKKQFNEFKCPNIEVSDDVVSRNQLISWYMFRKNLRLKSSAAAKKKGTCVVNKGVLPKKEKASPAQSFSYSYKSYPGISASPSDETLLMSNNNYIVQPSYYSDKRHTSKLPATKEDSFEDDDERDETS